jgi:hypothetical protein
VISTNSGGLVKTISWDDPHSMHKQAGSMGDTLRKILYRARS